MIRRTLLATAAVSLSLTATEASAHSMHQHHASPRHRGHHSHYSRNSTDYGERSYYGSNVAAARARGMAWCGAEMADELGIHGQQGRDLWLARNWTHVGTATSAHVGAVVVWPHHVGRIVGQENGQWVVQSGNDGARVRSRPRSLAGAIAIRDVGFGMAGTGAGEQPHGYVHTVSMQRHSHDRHAHAQYASRIERRTALWMHDETAQPDNFGAGFGTAGDERPHGYLHVASIQRHFHDQHVSRAEHRTPLWMHEDMIPPDRFGAASGS